MDEHRGLYRIASAAFLDTCRTVTDWDAPGLGEWTVRDLVGHTNRSHTNLVTYLEAGPEEGAAWVDGPVEYFAAFWGPSSTAPGPDAGAVAERGSTRRCGPRRGPGGCGRTGP